MARSTRPRFFLTKYDLNTLLLTNERAVERALIVPHDRQTKDERLSLQSSHQNGIGFTKHDAFVLSRFAEYVKLGNGLSFRQLTFLRRTNHKGFCGLAKYWRQLNAEAKQKAR